MARYLRQLELRVTKKTPESFVSWLRSLPPEIEVMLDKELATLRDEPVSGDVSLDVEEAGIGLVRPPSRAEGLRHHADAGGIQAAAQRARRLRAARKKGWRRLQFDLTPEDDEHLARLGLNPREFSAEPQRLHALQLADDAAKKFLRRSAVEQIQRRAGELKARVAPAAAAGHPRRAAALSARRLSFPGLPVHQPLRRHPGRRHGPGQNAANAGLAGLAAGNNAQRLNPPTLKLVTGRLPKSVMDNWHAEAERFYPGLRVRLWRGEPAGELPAARENSDLLVLNYAQLRSLSPDIAQRAWLAVILDEAQYIKNPNSQTAQAARALQAEHRLVLTGTPIENRLLDLWSIMGFAMPGVLGNRAQFARRFDAKDDPLARRRACPPACGRSCCAAPRRRSPRTCPTASRKTCSARSRASRRRSIAPSSSAPSNCSSAVKTQKEHRRAAVPLLTSLLRLRQICCHPALVNARLRERRKRQDRGAGGARTADGRRPEGAGLLAVRGDARPAPPSAETARVAASSTWRAARRTAASWSGNSSPPKAGAVFLISLKAGGFGLNLTAASYVVLFDPWWNPAVENQAIDRTHRIGQTNKVIAYRLLIRDSIEEKIRALQKQKEALAEDVLGEERFAQSLTLDDLRFLFAEGTDDFMSVTA